jgi:uncharacterized repeat protein (TIGR01451 family)
MKRYYDQHLWKHLLVIVIAAACPLFYTTTAHAFGATQCAGSRFGSNLGCTAKDVQLTSLTVTSGLASCVGGSTITVNLNATVNFGQATRYDIGVFISNDGTDPQLTSAASCSVAILTLSPFLNIDGDACWDGTGGISGSLDISNVTLLCKATAGSGGKLYIPFVVSWTQSASLVCNSNADPVPGTVSKCNAPTTAQGTVDVVVVPTITKTDNKTTLSPGESTTYYVVISNTTGVALSNAVFKDPAVTNLTVSSVTCSDSAGGTICPCVNCSVAAMQGAGITISSSMPVDSSITFAVGATLVSNPTGSITNTATVTVGSQTATATDTIGGKRVKIIKWREVFQ